MKVFTSSIRVKTAGKTEEINITDQVEATILESEIYEGMALVTTGHTTTSVYLNYADPDLNEDLQGILREIVPAASGYKHNKGEFGKNADAHIKSLLIGHGVTLPVTRGRLALGEWQTIYFSEFDGPRTRLISIKVMGLKRDEIKG
ncbi:MAG: secondary thiamine-phosphate synthase enzyme YjbQ [Thermodesulfobacteriota bacterium]